MTCIAAFTVVFAGCQRETQTGLGAPDDTGADTDSDTDVDSDTDTDADSDTDSCGNEQDWVGAECDPDATDGFCSCLGDDADALCFAWEGAPGGFCTKECKAATYEEPWQEGYDGLGSGYVCMDISGLTADPADDETGYPIVVEECIPQPLGQAGPCKASYQSCNPMAWAWESQFATCLMAKCQSDADCVVASGPACTGDGDCNTAEGETCSADSLCVFEADCDIESGRCTWEAGDEDAEPGDPCESSWDCNKNSICLLPDEDSDGKNAPTNGYCVSYGCKAANSAAPNGSGSSDPAIQDEFSCGMLGTCHNGFDFGGACLKRCNPPHDQPAFRCRQQSWDTGILDSNGDYDCYDFNVDYPIWTTGNFETIPATSAPACVWISRDVPLRVGTLQKCGTEDGELDAAQCSYFFGGDPTPWGLGMTCRNAETGELDPDGYCLDVTTSGPTETWDTDSDTI